MTEQQKEWLEWLKSISREKQRQKEIWENGA